MRAGDWDHPRACGEHTMRKAGADMDEGSSPRLRGTPGLVRQRAAAHGIIPALAGNTSIAVSTMAYCRDHPRACGEHRFLYRWGILNLGSSPRLRGTHGVEYGWVIVIGIIPALAGNTPPLYKSGALTWDHPRACGEHPIARVSSAGIGGSSPRLRGTHLYGA